MSNLETQIDDVAKGPASASNEQGSMSQHNLKDLIAADKHLKQQDVTNPFKKIHRAKIRPPGSA